jgi:hypothetical protein
MMSTEQKVKHEYPDRYLPGMHWATDEAWEILDTFLPPGQLTLEQRSYLAGLIAGTLMRLRDRLK